MRTITAIAIAGAALLLGVSAGTMAQTPYGTTVAILGANTEPSNATAAWKCGETRCFWTDGYTAPMADFAK